MKTIIDSIDILLKMLLENSSTFNKQVELLRNKEKILDMLENLENLYDKEIQKLENKNES